MEWPLLQQQAPCRDNDIMNCRLRRTGSCAPNDGCDVACHALQRSSLRAARKLNMHSRRGVENGAKSASIVAIKSNKDKRQGLAACRFSAPARRGRVWGKPRRRGSHHPRPKYRSHQEFVESGPSAVVILVGRFQLHLALFQFSFMHRRLLFRTRLHKKLIVMSCAFPSSRGRAALIV